MSRRRADAVVTIVVDAVLLYLVHVRPGWEQVSLLTVDAGDVVPLLDLSLVVGIAMAVVSLVHDSKVWRAVVELVTSAVALAVLVRTWQVFPFDVDGTASTVAHVVLVVLMLGTAIGVVVGGVHLVAALLGTDAAGVPEPAVPLPVPRVSPEAGADVALVVYESVFNDARAVAEAVAAGLSTRLPARTVDVQDAPPRLGPEVALLVVGAPNHRYDLPRPESRQEAARQLGAPDRGPGMREWLESLDRAAHGVPAAVFDTRLARPRVVHLADHAAETERRELSRAGFGVVAPPEHFLVASPRGPLVEGERDRARRWGERLGDALARRRAGTTSWSSWSS